MTVSRRQLLGGGLALGAMGCGLGTRGGTAGARDTGWDTGFAGLTTPAADGFAMPPEWAPHSGTIMQFPPPDNYCWQGQSCDFLEAARAEWAAVALAIAEVEPVVIYAEPSDAADLRSRVGSAVTIRKVALSDGWSRDSAPLFLTNGAGEVRASAFAFNGWGGSAAHADDALVKWEMAADFGVLTYDHDMVLEGGAVILDGRGTLITTEMCLLHPTRNPHLSKAEQTQILKQMLGVNRVIWLKDGWKPDPLTNGHVDGLCAFVSDNTVVLNSLDLPGDPNTAILADAKQRLLAEGVTVVDLPSTDALAFHINFYTCNDAIIVPVVGNAAADDGPLGILRDLHPGHRVVPIRATTLAQAGGGIHCITQQVPADLPWPF